MPKVEVDEAELVASRDLRNKVAKIFSHPNARRLVEQAYKMVDPNAATPQLDHDAEVNAPVKALEEKLDKFVQTSTAEREKEANERKLAELKNEIDGQYAQLKRDGWTDEGIAGVKAIADEKSLMPLDAAAIFERNHPPPTPVVSGSRSGPWNFMEQPDGGAGSEHIKQLIQSKGDSEIVLNRLINEGLGEVRGQSQPRR